MYYMNLISNGFLSVYICLLPMFLAAYSSLISFKMLLQDVQKSQNHPFLNECTITMFLNPTVI